MDRSAARKRALRERARGLVIPERESRCAELEARLRELPALSSASVVAGFQAIDPEPAVDFERIVSSTARLCYPVVSGDTLMFRVSAQEDLVPGPYPGLREPPISAPVIDVNEIDLIVVPGLAFDRRGVRLGRGKGFYDRVLPGAAATAALVGICFAECLIEEIPAEEWDARMHLVATDRALHRVIR